MVTVGELRDQWAASHAALPDRLIDALNTGGLARALDLLVEVDGATHDQIDAILRMALIKAVVELADYAREVTLLATDRTSAPALMDLARRLQEGITL